MSQHKSALRSQQHPGTLENSKYHQQARQLEELFPDWSNDDLQSLLVEVQGDVELAATRISDGFVEHWGSVSRKKDKKAPNSSHTSKETFSSRGDFRGARGGRGGRGGSTRGGASQRTRGGPSRGGAVNGRSPRVGSPNPAKLEGVPATSIDRKEASDPVDASSANTVPEPTNKNGAASSVGWMDPSASHTATPPSSTSWGAVNTTSAWGSDGEPNGSSAAVPSHLTKTFSKPANSKLSWAQVASSQEKLPPPTSAVPAPSSHLVSTPAPSAATQLPAPEPELETQTLSWEEPTTAQPPTWDEESQAKPDTSTSGGPWIASADVEEAKVEQVEPQISQRQRESKVETSMEAVPTEAEKQTQLAASKSEPAPLLPLATPALSQTTTAAASPKLSGRSTASTHRSSARYKNIDQPVVMPSSFGTGIEKIGMQFGSLSLGGETILDSNSSEPEPPIVVPETPSPHTPQLQAPAQHDPPPPAAAAPPSISTSIFSQQQTQPSISQSAPVQPSTTLHTLPPLISQTQQGTSHTASTSPIQQFVQQQHQQAQQQAQHHQAPPQAQQHSLTSAHQQQLQQQQNHPLHTPQTHQYTQHGLPTHLDPTQQAQSQQHQNTSHASYFGRSEAATSAPYFHTPTPPAGQGQDSPYGSFGQLNAQAPHQQASHLGSFAGDYGYGDSQRGFYDTYQQGSFGNRNLLVHEEVKGLQGTQQPTTSGIPPSSAQTTQPHGTLQGSGQPQPTSAQAPQQGYPVPYPYYTYPQSQQFYGYNPNYAAVPQPFKYPAMYQPPPGPGSAPSPVGKQPGTGVGVQPQGNPYNQGLYPQGGYDDYTQHPHHSQHSQQHSHGLGLGQSNVGASEYGKQLYGGASQGGIQTFMGIGGQGTGAAAPTSNAGGPRGAGSPETPYKPYAPKDVGSVAGRGAGQQQSQVQAQPQAQGQGGQGPPGQGFYSGARFGGNTGGAGAPQQSAHHPQAGPQGHLGYPQGGNDASFYQYRGQQQGYWQ